MSLQNLLSRAAERPFRTALLIVAGLVLGRLIGEFGSGFIDGLVIGFTDGV